VDDMPVKHEGRRRVWPVVMITFTLKISPVAFPAFFHRQAMESCAALIPGPEQNAKIGEGERHAAAAGPQARNLHDRQQALQLAITQPTEVKKAVPVGFVQHPGPGTSVET